MKKTFFLLFVIFLTQFAVSLKVNAENMVVNKGSITIYVGEEKTLYHSIPYQYYVNPNSSWFIRQRLGSGWSDGQEDYSTKIISKDYSSCTIKGIADNESSYNDGMGYSCELHCKGTRQSIGEYYECYWKIIVKSRGDIFVDANPSFGNWNNPTMVQAGSKVYLTARTSDGSSASDATIYYTTDGNDATVNSTRYTSEGVTITKKTYISAIASKNGYSPVRCGGYFDVIQNIPVNSITLNKTSLSLQTGQSETLTATVKPDNATDKTVKWSSSNTSVATVSEGKVTAKAKGSATITCTAHDGSGVKETCAVTVTEPDPAPKVDILSVTCEKTTLKQSESLVMHATLKNRDETRTMSTRLVLCDDEMHTLYYSPSDRREYKTDEKVSVDFSFPLDTIPVGKYKATVQHLSKWLDDGKWYWTYDGNKAIDVNVISNPNPKLELSATPGSGQVPVGTTVTLTAKAEGKIVTGCDIYYTTNGNVPTKYSTKYSTGITISSNCTIKAFAYKDGYETSSVLTETYTVKNEDDFTDISKYANIVYMEPVTASAGNAITVPVRMKNAQANIMGFQFDLVLPTGITLAKDVDNFYKVDLSADRTSSKKHTVSSQQQTDGSIRVVCYSNNNSTFSGTEGNVLELTLNVASSVKEGDYALKLRDLVMTTPNLDSYSVPWVVSKLTIEDYIPGDVNGSGKVDVVDVAGAVNLILNSGDTSKLNRKAADINGDNIINVVDVAGIVNIILNGNTGAKSRTMSSTLDDGQPLLYFNALPIEQGETIALPIMLNTADGSFTGCQFDLYLPEGLSVAEEDGFPLVEVGSGTTARKHTVSTSEQADGSLRVVCYSNNNYTFSGSEILTIAIHADTDAPVGNASVSMRNITLSRPDVTGIDLADYDNELIISSGIEGVIVDQQSDMKVFSLSGQQLDAPRKGVNIVGGKKVMVK